MSNVEWSPQQWLPQPKLSDGEFEHLRSDVMRCIFEAVTLMPDLADVVLKEFGVVHSEIEERLPYGTYGVLSKYFDIENGHSTGEKNYIEGTIPYISSGDSTNSIISLIDSVPEEVFEEGGITVTAFGKAALQPWPFMARGYGGSSVRVLLPKYKMSLNELLWFVVQINRQRWRFFYARMAIKGRIANLEVSAPPKAIVDNGKSLFERVRIFHEQLEDLVHLKTKSP
jgi:Type I restriction modification DNA specificity domain